MGLSKAQHKQVEELLQTLEYAKVDVEMILSDRQSDFDSKSNRWQESDKGDEAQEVLDSLDEAATGLEDVLSSLNDADRAQ